MTLAALSGPDFSRNPFTAAQILQRLLTSPGRYGFSHSEIHSVAKEAANGNVNLTLAKRCPKLTPLSVAGDKAMRLLGVLVGWLALAATYPALANEKFDPKHIRVITPTTATSKCIGDPKTPICAVETFMACSARLDMSLCERVGIHEFHLPDKAETVRYRILKVRILKDKDIPKKLQGVDWMKPGYADITLVLPDIIYSWCPKGCQKDFSVKPTAKGWEIVSWALQGIE